MAEKWKHFGKRSAGVNICGEIKYMPDVRWPYLVALQNLKLWQIAELVRMLGSAEDAHSTSLSYHLMHRGARRAICAAETLKWRSNGPHGARMSVLFIS